MGIGAVVIAAVHAGGQRAELLVNRLYEGVGGTILAVNLHGDTLAAGVAHGVRQVATGKSTGSTEPEGGNNTTGAAAKQLTSTQTDGSADTGTEVLGGGGGLTLHLVSGNNGGGQNLLGHADFVCGNGTIAGVPCAGGKPQRSGNKKKG